MFRLYIIFLFYLGDDDHASEYELSSLEKLTYQNYQFRLQRKYILWTKDTIKILPVCHVGFSDLLQSEESVKKLVKSLIDYGVGFIENVSRLLKKNTIHLFFFFY